MSYYIGLMSGTSMDAVDAALVEFANDRLKLIHFCKTPIPDSLSKTLSVVRGRDIPLAIDQYGQLDVRMGKLFAEAALRLLRDAGQRPEAISAVGSHGQTILHQPNGPDAFSLQIANPNVIAALTGITTIADFRNMDIAVGGQGAPLTPAFHEFQFRSRQHHRIVLNIGGIANITILPTGRTKAISGFDTGPGNALLDDWMMKNQGLPMDKDGLWAQSGKVHELLLQKLKADPYFRVEPPKSTGRDYFNLEWLTANLNGFEPKPPPADIQATLTRLTVETIADAIRQHAPETQEVLVYGGGAYNLALMNMLDGALKGMAVYSTERLGVKPECVEAVAFAWLAKCRLEGRTANLPSVTGASRAVVLGAIYAGKVRDQP
jgi:anhydro-N-acetylmuramic acid kinase